MRFLDDFFPALVFFIVYKLYGIYWGTFALIIGCALQIIYFQIKYKKVEKIYWITFFGILIFGGATIIFRDPKFLMWKVSLANWLFGIVFLGSHFFKKSLLEIFLKAEDVKKFPAGTIRMLNHMWGWFFLILGTLNIYIGYYYPLNVWVDFKVFGMFGITIVFILIQAIYLHRKFKKHR
jgi:intracellular septation protein